MRPVYFPQSNCIMGHDQVGLNALPAFRGSIPHKPTPGNDTEIVVSCYRLNDTDLEELCKNRVIWMSQVVACRGPLQPQSLQIASPFLYETELEWDGKGLEKENWKKR
jgi:hypothetical protein